jgi:membrane-bound lytic murein transglycosylase B
MTARSVLNLPQDPAGRPTKGRSTIRSVGRIVPALALSALLGLSPFDGMNTVWAAGAGTNQTQASGTGSAGQKTPENVPKKVAKPAPKKALKASAKKSAKAKRPAAKTSRPAIGKVALAAGSGAVLSLAATSTSTGDNRTTSPSIPTELSGWLDRPEARQLVERLAQDAQIPADWSRQQLAQAQRSSRVQQLIAPPPKGTAKDWAAYRARFVEPKRIQAGADFWQTNARSLRDAQERWGVPAEVIVGIVGVETFYGRMTGGFRALDALATLAFDYPEGGRNRSAFFLGELEALLKLAWQQQVNAADFRGSFAGALGLPQFMPSSILKWAVDADGDGHIRLHDSPADVIGSVANFLKEHGWQEGLTATLPVSPPTATEDKAHLLGPDIRPSFTAGQMRERGAVLASTVADTVGPLALVELQNGDMAPSYVAGTSNFYALTRYNQSSYYAMAVLSLGQAVKATRGDPVLPAAAKP